MFDAIRKHQRLFLLLLLLLIFPAFVFFGVSDYKSFMGVEDSVATVGRSKITRQEFEEARRAQLERLRQVLGPQADAKLLDTPDMVQRIVDDLVVQRALSIEADARRVRVSDERLREAIAGISGLRRPDGSFDLERYRAMLTAQGMSGEVFEARVRQDLAVQTLPEALAWSSFVPGAVAVQLAALQAQTRTVREQRFRADDHIGKIKPTQDQLKAYHEQNSRQFQTAESAKVEMIVLGAEAIARQVSVTEEEMRGYYEQNARRFATPEQRRASHILLKLEPDASAQRKAAVRAQLEALQKQARGGADFSALARKNSEDPGSATAGGDLGFFPRDAMVKPFADAAFALKEGALSEIVESEFGLHLIKLTGIRPGSERSFEQVRGEIESELRRQLASKRFAESAETFSNLVYEQSDSLKPAAERFKLAIDTVSDLTRTGGTALPAGSPLANPKLLAALFSEESIKSRRNTEAIEVGGNTLVSARIIDYRPAQVRPFEEVEAQVRQRYVETESLKLAVEAGRARLAQLQAGESVDAKGFSAPREVARTGKPVISPAALDPVFRAPTAKLPSFVGVDLGAEGFAVYEVSAVRTPPPEELEKGLERLRQQLAQTLGQQSVTDFVASLKGRSDVKTYPQRASGQRETR